MANKSKYKKSSFKGKIAEIVKMTEALRLEGNDGNPMEVSFDQVLRDRHNIGFGAFIHGLGIDPNIDSIQNINTLDIGEDIRWIIPEVFRAAIKLGMDRSPIHPNITAGTMPMKQLKAIMPYINEADAAPRRVGEGETIPLGTISFGQKEVEVYKIGRGIKITDELRQYATIEIVSLFMQDFGSKLGRAQDVLALNSIINGDIGGSDSATTVGVGTATTKAYKDFLRIWVRMSRIGRNPNIIIGGEDAALDTLDLPEFKTNTFGGTAPAGVVSSNLINLKTPVPKNASYYIHGNVPANQEIMIDPKKALIKLDAQPLKLESERIVSNQTEASYVTLTTGFGKLFRDASIIMDKSLAFSGNGFPSYMDVDEYENIVIED